MVIILFFLRRFQFCVTIILLDTPERPISVLNLLEIFFANLI